MEEDNLPSGKSGWLLIKACFSCCVGTPVCYSKHLMETLKIKRYLVLLSAPISDKTGTEEKGLGISAATRQSDDTRSLTNNKTVCFKRLVYQKQMSDTS